MNMNEIKINNPALKPLFRELKQIAGYLWERGWAERNAGNISVNISELLNEQNQVSADYTPMPVAYPLLANMSFMITVSGSRMRNIAQKPLRSILLIKLNREGNSYCTLGEDNRETRLSPTSELHTHLAMHQLFVQQKTNQKAIIHAHATELIALTHEKTLCNESALNLLLWSVHPETITFLPEGVGFVPYILPGTEDIASETRMALKNHKVIVWEKHGVFSTGKTLTEAFDFIDILSKSAAIYFTCKSAGIQIEKFPDSELEKLTLAGKIFLDS